MFINQKTQHTLHSLGFNEKEIQIYLSALQVGTAPVSKYGDKFCCHLRGGKFVLL